MKIGIKSQNFVWPIFGPHNNLLDVLEKKVVILVINFFQQVWKEFSGIPNLQNLEILKSFLSSKYYLFIIIKFNFTNLKYFVMVSRKFLTWVNFRNGHFIIFSLYNLKLLLKIQDNTYFFWIWSKSDQLTLFSVKTISSFL